MQPVAIYTRVSTDEQAKDGVSLAAQEATLRAYCTMRGLYVVDVISDDGISGGKPLYTRPGGQRLLKAIVRKRIVGVIAYKLDRLFRDTADALTVTRAWDKVGVALHLVDLGGQTLDSSSAMGRFFLTMLAGIAELERNLIGERTRLAMQYKARRGEYTGGALPIGNALVAGILQPDTDEAELVALIRTYRAEGLSIRAIAERLNREGRKARGQQWHPTTVARILKRDAA